MNLLVSVIMPAYNAEKFIGHAIDSVLIQTYQNWELLVVDDESTDRTASIVKSYAEKDTRIQYHWQKNGRQGNARNRGIKNAKGSLLAFLDADDLWVADKLENQVDQIRNQDVDLVFGYSFLLENGIRTEKKIGRGSGKYQGECAVNFLLYHDAFIMSTVLVRREAVLSVDLFVEDLNIQYCEDWHLYLKLAYAGYSFYTGRNVFSYYRISESSATAFELQANIKFFNALISIDKRFPGNKDLQDQIIQRINGLVFDSKSLEPELVKNFYSFLGIHKPTGIPRWVFLLFLKVSVSGFRKIFLLIYS